MSDRISGMARAMQGWDRALTVPVTRPGGLFGQKIIVQCAGMTIDGDKLDCEFTIPFDDDTEANEAEIAVYNLSKDSRARLQYNEPITVTAGYGEDTGVIFSGRISKVTTRPSGADDKTTILALDAMDLKERKIDSVSYQKGTKASYILKDLIGRLGLPLAVFKPVRDYTYAKGANMDGELMEAIRKYAKVCGVSAYVCKGRVYVRDLWDGDDIGFTVSEATGLIGTPEEFEEELKAEDYTDTVKGYNFKMLLQHRMTTAAVIHLESRGVSGVFRVRGGTHSFDGANLITECEVIA